MTLTQGVSLRGRLDELYRFERSGMRPGLVGVERLLELGGRPDRSFPAVLIAGTNGKGSTAAHLDSILRAAGMRTGLFTSPHLIRFHERIRVDGREIDDEALDALLARWWPRFERERPSFFEATTALCFDHFASASLDIAVVEVGLGGRLDSTNILEAGLSVITTISSDHTEILGRTLRRIALEKAGIVKRNGKLALGVSPRVPKRAILETAAEQGASVALLGRDARYRSREITREGTEFWLTTRSLSERVRTPLLGYHQARNAALAALAAEMLLAGRPRGAIAGAIRRGIGGASWPGRAQAIAGDPPVLVDAAHNVEGATALARTVKALFPGRPIAVVAAFSRDKAHERILGALGQVAGRFVLTQFSGERATPASSLLAAVPNGRSAREAEAVPRISEALARAKAWALARGGAVLVTGSLFLVGEALPVLGSDVPRTL
jgi:dihydrofolate synthase/folylpolyglutamate synthase